MNYDYDILLQFPSLTRILEIETLNGISTI